MCFSATASFTAGAVLLGSGITAQLCARNTAQRVLAGIPLLFGLQQLTEGLLWLSLMHAEYTQYATPATYAFLVFAQLVWPVYIPFSVLLFETQPVRKKIMQALLLAGIALSAYLAYSLIHYPVTASCAGHHIRYELGSPIAETWFFGILYFIPTIVAPIASGIKRLHWLGYLFFLSYALARLLLFYFIISVWCFFGAIISAVVLGMILQFRKPVAA